VLYVDTNILIYLLEQHERFSEAVARTLETAGGTIVTSTITIVEFLAGTVSSSLATLQQVPRLQFISLDEHLAEQAAAVQRRNGLQIGDAIHIATAIEQHADAFFTHDKRLAKVAAEYMAVKGL
jgi:predicted nucleic acid-binding protein